MSASKVQVGAKQFSDILGPWCPKGVESSVEVEAILADTPELFDATEEALGMLLQELCMDYDDGAVHGKFYTSMISIPREKEFDYYYLAVLTNGDPGVPKGRALLLLPEELMANDLLWKLLQEKHQKSVASVVEKKAGVQH